MILYLEYKNTVGEDVVDSRELLQSHQNQHNSKRLGVFSVSRECSQGAPFYFHSIYCCVIQKINSTTPYKLGRAVGFWTRESRDGVEFEIVL